MTIQSIILGHNPRKTILALSANFGIFLVTISPYLPAIRKMKTLAKWIPYKLTGNLHDCNCEVLLMELESPGTRNMFKSGAQSCSKTYPVVTPPPEETQMEGMWHYLSTRRLSYSPKDLFSYFCRLSELGYHVGSHLLDLFFLREKGYKREIKLLNMLLFVKSNLWKVSDFLFSANIFLFKCSN